MRAFILRVVALILLLANDAHAQVYSQGVIGYASCSFVTGSNLFSNPFQTGGNDLNTLFQPTNTPQFSPSIPQGMTVSLWNPATSSFYTNSTFTNGSWSVDLVLTPGTGVLVYTPSPFNATFVGTVLNHDGSIYTGNLTLPPLFSEPNGIYLVGDKCPVVDVGTNIFLNIIGRMPFVGEQVIQISGTSTYLGSGMWDSVPTLDVGDAAYLKIMAEPSPWLTIVYANNQAIVSWPLSFSGWTLQTNSDLANGTWGSYNGLITNNTVTNTVSASDLFFRLSYQ